MSDDLGDYCNVQCQAIRAKRTSTNVPKTIRCALCSTEFVTRKWRAVRYCSTECKAEANRIFARERHREEMAKRGPVKIWSCGFCGGEIEVPVSYTGAGKYHDDCKIKARRARNRIKTVRRQGVKSDQKITHEEIAERDGYVCHICNELVDMTLPRTSKLGATLDHVVPISKGGVDSLDNLKLAHWVCNVRKSNKMEDINA